MTSRISFSSLVCSERKKLNWLLAVQALVFGLLMPFRVLLVMAVRSSENVKYGYDWNMQSIFGEMVGFGQMENTLFILAAGALCALAAFAYLHSAVKLDFYHSLAVKREQLFAVKIVSSTITFLIPYVLCQGLNIVIGMCYGVVNATIVMELLVDTLLGILQFLCSYAGTLLAIMLTGKMVTTFFALLTLGGYVPVVFVMFMGLHTLFLTNSMTDYDNYANAVLYYSSPWAFCLYRHEVEETARQGVTGHWPSLAYLCQLVAVIVILLLICVWLYRRRRTEAAGSALAFRKIEGVIKILLTVLAGLAAAMIAYEMLDNLIWELVFIVLFGGLACAVMEFIYRADIRQVLSHKLHIVITVVLAAGVFLFMKYDVTGYNSYVPAKEEIAAMAMKDNMLRIQYDLGNGYPSSYQTIYNSEILDYLETEEFDRFYELAVEGAAFDEKKNDWEDVFRVGVKYRLKNGKEIYRAYWVDWNEYLEALDEQMQDPQFREKMFPILTWDEQMVEDMLASVSLPDEQMAVLYNEILKAATEEIAEGIDLDNNEVDESADESMEEFTENALDGDEEATQAGSDYSEDELTNAYYAIYGQTFSSNELWRVVQAYQQDLEELTYSEIQSFSGELHFHWNERAQVYYGDYPLSMKFTHTMEVLAEVLAE